MGFFSKITATICASANARERYRTGALLAASGVFVVSFDALLVRLCATDGWNVSFWRGLFMAVTIGLVLLFQVGRRPPSATRSPLLPLLAVSLLMACSSIALVLAFTLTATANAVVILSASPLFCALFSWLWLRERCAPRTLISIAVAMGGVLLVVSGSLRGANVAGDLLALLATMIIGIHFTVLRRFPEVSRQAAVGVGGLLMAVLAFHFADPLSLTWQSYTYLLLMGLVQMPLAMVLMTAGTRFLSAAEVSLFILGETFLAPIWVWLVFGEIPSVATFIGGSIIILTLVLNSLLGLRSSGE
ncbi:MAG: DMT family transporter [Deltaproteobacteria bacterium]|nr:DMT family transporter [Deltaproteobacteria bacterium]